MLVSSTALLLACTSFFLYDLFTFREATARNLSVQAQIIGSNTVSALVFNDPKSAEVTLSALKASPRILEAEIYTSDGRPFAGYRQISSIQRSALPAIPVGQARFQWFDGRQIVLVNYIIFERKQIGFICIRSDWQSITNRLQGFSLISAVVLLLCSVAALVTSRMCQRVISGPMVQLAQTARTVSRERNYSIRASTIRNEDELSVLIDAFNEMLTEIQRRDTALQKAHDELEQRVHERTAQLAVANKELEAFSYSVSHDLRAPLRSIDGFSQALLEDCSDKLDTEGKQHLQRVRTATQRMALLIDDLLRLARVSRGEMRRELVDLNNLARSIADELRRAEPGRVVEFVFGNNPMVTGDSELLRIVMENLLGNAWKYTSGHHSARIQVDCFERNGKQVHFVSDDGAGFEQRYADRLFTAFQRLHTVDEFPGTGIGLATVQRIIQRHGGEVWAEGAVERGATFYFVL